MEQAIASFPPGCFDAVPNKKYFPMLHTTWDPAVLGLGRVALVCPELLEHIVDENRDVDQIKGFLVDVQAQTALIDRVELEAQRNGPYSDDVIVMPSRAQIAPRENDESSEQHQSWKGPYTQQMEEAFRSALDVLPPPDSSLSNFPQPSYATRWHEKRRDDLMKHPEISAFCKSNTAFPLSVAIGLVGALLNVYTIAVYVPRVVFRTMLSTASYKQEVVDTFTLQSVFGETLGSLLQPVESLMTLLSPFAVMGNWMETSLADSYKVFALTALLVHIILLAAVWGWWTNTMAYAMTCELMMETVGSVLAAESKPSRNVHVQRLRVLAKHLLAIAINPMAISGIPFEHALLGYRGHVEFLGSGEVLQAQHRILTGAPTHASHMDGALSMPHNVLLQQRRWKALLKDKYGTPVQAFPIELLSAARLRHFVSRMDLLREEARLLEDGGKNIGPGLSILDSAGMEAFVRSEIELREAAASSGNHLEKEFGPQKRAMAKVMLFAKEFFTTVRGASTSDLRILASRANFQVTDPRPLKSLVELVHPAIKPAAYQPFQMETSPSVGFLRPYPTIGLWLRDSGYLFFYTAKHWFDSVIMLTFMSMGLISMHILATLQHMPLYRQTLGKLWDFFGKRYQKDNHGMFLSVTGCLLLTKRAAGLMWQGLRYGVAAFMWYTLVFAAAKSSIADHHVQPEIGYSSWTVGFAVLFIVSVYGGLAELFSLGFLWHPMWFVYATGHMTIQQTADIDVSSSSAAPRAADSEWAQPTVSMYSPVWFWLSFGQTHHVEQHDFPKLPWIHRAQLRQRAPAAYGSDSLHKYNGLMHAMRTYMESKGRGVYAGQGEA